MDKFSEKTHNNSQCCDALNILKQKSDNEPDKEVNSWSKNNYMFGRGCSPYDHYANDILNYYLNKADAVFRNNCTVHWGEKYEKITLEFLKLKYEVNQ